MCLTVNKWDTWILKLQFWKRKITVYKEYIQHGGKNGFLSTSYQDTPIYSGEFKAEGKPEFKIRERWNLDDGYLRKSKYLYGGAIHVFLDKRELDHTGRQYLECTALRKDLIAAGTFNGGDLDFASAGFKKIYIPKEEINRVLND